MSDPQPDRSTADRPNTSIRWWPGVLILIATVFIWINTWSGEVSNAQSRVFRSMAILLLAGFLTFLWLMFFARLPRGWRRRILLGMLAIGILLPTLFRIQGVTGNFVPILSPRWSGEAALDTGSGRASSVTTSPYDFPQFLGSQRDATITGVRLARDWQASPPTEVWRRPVGDGWSGFAVVGDAAVTQEQRDGQETVVRYNLRTGEVEWSSAADGNFDSTIGGNGPRGTPTIVDNRVFTFGPTGLVRALDLNTGEILWSRQTAEETGATLPEWGYAGSPLVLGDLVIVAPGSAADGSVTAWNRDSGELVWKSGTDFAGYASPTLRTVAGREQILVFGKSSLASYSPADGELLWQQEWSKSQPNVAQPMVLDDDRIFLSSGYGIGAKMFQVALLEDSQLEDSQFTITELWSSPRLKAKFTNPVFYEGYIYGLDDGVMTCIDPNSGDRVWKRGRYGHGQLLLVNNLLLVQTENGEIVLLEATPEAHRELGRFEALEGKSWNTPTLAGPYLLVRNSTEAACYQLPLAD